MAVAPDKSDDRWPTAVLVVSVSACVIFSILDAVRARPPAGYPIRIVLPRADPQAGYPILLKLPIGAPAREVATPAIRDENLAAPDFDLADPYAARSEAGSGGSALVIVRPARINGRDAGSAGIRVSAQSTLSIEASALARMLERAGHGDLAGRIGDGSDSAGFIGFDELRRQGIDVRYDPESNHILIAV